MYFKEEVKDSSDEYMRTYNVMRLGDIAFEGNKSKNYAHGRFVENTIGDGIVSHVFDVFRPIEKYDLQFWKYLINNEGVMGRIMMRCTKASTMMTNLVASDFLKEEISVPFIEEQKTIGQYFSRLDHLITLHQRKRLDWLKVGKNAWEQRKLGDVVDVYDGVHQTPEYQKSGIMFLSVENITTLKSNKFISEEDFERDYKVYPEKGDILMTRIGDVGTPNVVETSEKVAFYVSLALLKPNGINSYFLCNALKTSAFQKGLRERTLVTAMPQKINKDEIGKVFVFITPNIEEQQKIGAYFKQLDYLITLHQQK